MVAGVQLAHKEQAVAEILQGVIADCKEAGHVAVDAVGMVVVLRVECSGHNLEGVLGGILEAEAENIRGVVLGGSSALDPEDILVKDLEHILAVEQGCSLVEGRKSTSAVVFEDSLVVPENNFGDVHAVVHADVVFAEGPAEAAEALAVVLVVVSAEVLAGVHVVVLVVVIAAVENAEVVLVVGDFYVDGDGGPS